MPPHPASGLLPLPPFDETPAGRDAWSRVAAYAGSRPFLRSEGVGAQLGAPRRAAPWLVEQSRELVRRFDDFYRLVLASPAFAAEPALEVGQPLQKIIDAEGERPRLPLSRFDCVVGTDGVLKVIELNPVGVCTLHLRSAAYLATIIHRRPGNDAAHEAVARAIDRLRVHKIDAIERYVSATTSASRRRIGIVLLPGMHRGSLLFWRHELGLAGYDLHVGRPEDLGVAHGVLTVRERPVDTVWIDWIAYLGFQQQRYEQTRFATKSGNFSAASLVTKRFLELPDLPRILADRASTLLSPIASYRAISKAILAWIDRPELALSPDDRAYLRTHVTETLDHSARLGGVITPERARHEREDLVLKPCRFGGAHGVVVGRDCAAETWARQVDEVWADAEWILQRFVEPVTDSDGARLSHGVYNYAGELGGILVRSASQRVISARTADAIVAVWE